MPREIYGPRAPLSGRVQPVIQGGTGTDNLVDAPASLGLIDNTKKNVDNGVVGLDSTAKLPAAAFPLTLGINSVNIDGTFSVGINGTATFQITDYDSFRAYTVGASAGTVSISGDTITFVAPGTTQTVMLTVNGRSIPVTITPVAPATPSITSPVNGATGAATSGVSFTSSAFVSGGDASTHLSSDWQVATDSAFNNIVSQSMGDTTNKTSWLSGALSVSTTYYARVRYRANTASYSNYSATVSFTTSATTFSGLEEAKIIHSESSASIIFGGSVSTDVDCTRLAIGAPGYAEAGTTVRGVVYIFIRNGTVWTQEARLLASDSATGSTAGSRAFGSDVSMTRDGTRIIIGAEDATVGSVANAGKAYVFSRSGTTWSQEVILTKPTGMTVVTAGDNFGNSVSISGDGTRIAVGAQHAASETGQAYIWLRSGTTWTLEKSIGGAAAGECFGTAVSLDYTGTRCAISGDDNSSNSASQGNQGVAYVYLRTGTAWAQEVKWALGGYFGADVSICDDGSRVAIGSFYAAAGATSTAGACYIYVRNTTTNAWTQEAKLVALDPGTTDYFGQSVSISADGSRVVSGAFLEDPGGTANAGSAYVHSRTGTAWAQEAKLVASDKVTNSQYGRKVIMSGNGNRVAIGAPQASNGAVANYGGVYVYR